MKQAIVGLLFLSMMLTAQPDRKRRPPMDHPGQRLEMMKMWRLTEELNLSEDQAGKFFPRYNALEKEIMEMNKDQKELLGSLREKENSSKEISQKELDEITKKMSDLEQRKIQKKQQFFEDLDNLLTTDQRARYLGFELRFMEDLRKGMRDRMGRIDRLKGPSGKKRYMKKMNGKMRKDGWR